MAVRIHGPETGTGLGFTVATAYTGLDSYADILAGGSITRLVGGDVVAYPGEVHLIRGSFDRRSRDLALRPAEMLVLGADALDPLRPPGERNIVDFAGWSLSDGDVNGDGRGDVVLGVIGGDGPDETRWEAGEVAVIYGRD